MTDPKALALLGTGVMGAGMGRNLARAGFAVRVWNRSPDKAAALADVGAAAQAAGADVGLLQRVAEHLDRGVAAGHGDLDLAATYLAHRPV